MEWIRLTEGWQDVLPVPFSPSSPCQASSMCTTQQEMQRQQHCPGMWLSSIQWEKTRTSASASVPSHVFLKWSADTPLLSDPVVLETGIQRPGRMSSVLNVLNVLNVPHSRQPRERGLFWWQDKSISSDRSLCSRVNVVQKDELLPPLTLIPIRWKIKLISFRGEWGRGWRRAEQSVEEMWQGRRQPGLRVAGRRSGKDPEREGTRNKLNCLEMTLVWNIFHYWKFLSIIIYVLFII